jgi:hypothetical protein
LRLDEAQAGPHDVDLLAAVGIALEAIRPAQAVVIACSLKQLGEGARFIAWQVYGNRDSLLAVARLGEVLRPPCQADYFGLTQIYD